MKNLITLLFALCLSALALANESVAKVTPLTLPAGSNSGEITGNLKDGAQMDLNWAAQSNVAAFPGTRFEMFNGNHKLYRVTLPAASKIDITLTPEAGKLINLYALRLGVDDQSVPPNIQSAISAEASYPRYANLGGGRKTSNSDDGVRKIDFMSISSPYTILIGVAGANGLTDGNYKLQVNITGR